MVRDIVLPVLEVLKESRGPAATMAVLGTLPLGKLVMLVYCAFSTIFLATSVDSGCYVVASVATRRIGVNDDPAVMEELVRGLLCARIKPYYLFQCDLVRGIEHFRTPISRGLEIMERLRGRVSGLAIPCYAFDVPGGEGKVPLLPEYVVSKSETHTVLRTWRGLFFDHPEPRPAGAAPGTPAGTSWGDDFCARAITDRRTSDRDFGEWLEEIPEA